MSIIEKVNDSKIMELAKEWLAFITVREENDKNDKNQILIRIPIDTIDELPVEVEIIFNTFTDSIRRVTLIIKSKNIFFTPVSEYRDDRELYYKTLLYTKNHKKWTIDILQESITSFVDTLNHIKFDCYSNHFNWAGFPNVTLLKDIFKGDKVSMLDESCCICHEDTRCKTRCRHTMCLRCWSKLKIEKQNNCDEDECTCDNVSDGHICPICRSFMRTKKELGSNDS